jgi:FSR family fosmidomycin resistance protein-like MFS transporter
LGKAAYLSLGHFVNDLYPAFLPPLLPILVDKFQLTFTRASLLATVLSFSASLTQPIFGYLSDKLGGRKMVVFGPMIGGLCLSLIGLADQYSFLIPLLVLGGLGVASYHPEAAALTASLASRKRTLAMSIFMLGGNAGYGLGPFLILFLVTALGMKWSFIASLPALGLGWLMHKRAPFPSHSMPLPPAAGAGADHLNLRVMSFGLLLALVVLRVTAALSLTTFLPMIQKLRGFSLMAAGSSFTVFMICGAVGGLTGGLLADRMGRKTIILSSFILIIPAFLGFLFWKGPASFLILALLGFLFFLSEPACIVLAQEMAPRKAGTVSGLIMGLAWGLAGFGVLGTGALADSLGIEGALRFLLLLPAGALILSFFLPPK